VQDIYAICAEYSPTDAATAAAASSKDLRAASLAWATPSRLAYKAKYEPKTSKVLLRVLQE